MREKRERIQTCVKNHRVRNTARKSCFLSRYHHTHTTTQKSVEKDYFWRFFQFRCTMNEVKDTQQLNYFLKHLFWVLITGPKSTGFVSYCHSCKGTDAETPSDTQSDVSLLLSTSQSREAKQLYSCNKRDWLIPAKHTTFLPNIFYTLRQRLVYFTSVAEPLECFWKPFLKKQISILSNVKRM